MRPSRSLYAAPPRRLARHRKGFTLLEAMVVVAIIGITAALAAPSLGEAMANRRASEATHMVVRIGARARAEAIGYGRAHILRYSDASESGSFGSLELWRGRTNRCTGGANDWPTIITGTCAASPDCIDELDMSYYDFPINQVRLRLDGASDGYICFQPDGEMYWSTNGVLFTAAPPAGTEAIRFRIRRMQSGSDVGVERGVVFPFGGTPRVYR